MNTDTASTGTRRRSFLAVLMAGTAGVLMLPFRLSGRQKIVNGVSGGASPVIRPHPDAVPRTSKGASTHV